MLTLLYQAFQLPPLLVHFYNNRDYSILVYYFGVVKARIAEQHTNLAFCV